MSYDVTLVKTSGGFKIKDAQLLYCKHTNYGDWQYGKEPVKGADPWVGKEYSVAVLVTESIFKKIRTLHKKSTCKRYTRSEFVEKYKVDPPMEAEEYFIMSFSKESDYEDGTVSHPINVLTLKREDLSDTAVGNGSIGSVVVNVSEYNHTKFGKGTSVRLKSILVKELVEYVAGTSTEQDFGDEFDDEDDDFSEEREVTTKGGAEEEEDEWEED